MTRNLTFERILASYLLVAAALAVAIPSSLSLDKLLGIPVRRIPFASWLSLSPKSLAILPTYFLVLAALVPFVVIALALRPQAPTRFPYAIPSLDRCLVATLLVPILFITMWHVMFRDSPPNVGGYSKAELFYYASVSRVALILLGPLMMGGVTLVAYIGLVKVPRMWLGYSRRQFG